MVDCSQSGIQHLIPNVFVAISQASWDEKCEQRHDLEEHYKALNSGKSRKHC